MSLESPTAEEVRLAYTRRLQAERRATEAIRRAFHELEAAESDLYSDRAKREVGKAIASLRAAMRHATFSARLLAKEADEQPALPFDPDGRC